MLESESRYLPVLTDSTSPCRDIHAQPSVISDGDSCQSSLTFENQELTKNRLKSQKAESLAAERNTNRSNARRIKANFHKPAADLQSLADSLKSRDSCCELPLPSDVGRQQAAETVDVISTSPDSYKPTYASGECARASTMPVSASAEFTKLTAVSNDVVKSGPIKSHTKPRRQPQPRTDSTLSGQLIGEGRRLLKNVIKKPPGRRDESGLLFATSSSLYTPEKYRNTMRQIFGESCTDDGKMHTYDPDSQSHKLYVPQQVNIGAESKFDGYLYSDIFLQVCVTSSNS